MINRFMRVLIMYDLPMVAPKNRKDYRKFRKDLLKEGFLMMQESIYVKLVQNQQGADAAIAYVRKVKPPEGLVQALVITEKQYGRIEYILGESASDTISSTDPVVFL